ncbi:PhzF family phenazine biosynthesis protein [Pontixanthobacter aestiaquae]|uniref:PhzF family phenazine biosynthesis isomerase n=1 Tax=Pontixanthobacter aestiaquae TaxID=1509367 RepID=A0A844YZZ4_9SPHN|nr:PhzF family phenazine biosynthesis protein [Pontixanthobacter aestiaquae]MDN3646968.1 PhzF family phenazine biosynthesis protein [Pontixanthobacter aestiaquae]MXO82051.1 PhzF family phenazine biosynthesis isomerase [Pontixanthobacter aestiaquae]
MVSPPATAVPYYHVDAFADRPFVGNQAAVMILDEWLPDDVLVEIGGENMFAETAFVVKDETGEADWELRWCTPTYEIALCGHATLASGHVLLSRDGGDHITFRTRKAGILEVRREGEDYEVGLPAIETAPEPYPEAVALLGAEPVLVHRNDTLYNIFLFENAEQVRALDPDLRALGEFGVEQFACTAPGGDTDVISRVFVPGAGVDEDSVTGSAHAALTPFWAERLGRNSFSAYQASRRGGYLNCRLDGDRVWLGGKCTTVVEGTFYVSG